MATANWHALANLVRYHFLMAQFDEAEVYATRLQEASSDKPDLELKRAEAFAYLGEDEQVWAAYERDQAKNNNLYPCFYIWPLWLHIAWGGRKRPVANWCASANSPAA